MKQVISFGKGLPAAAAKLMLTFPKTAELLPGLQKYRIWTDWPTSTISDNLDADGIMDALRKGPYGRCVFQCDNDQAEHQEVLLRFKSGANAVFRMTGFSHREGRTLRIDGSRGVLQAKFGASNEITVTPHGSMRGKRYFSHNGLPGHSEADEGLMAAWSCVFDGYRPDSSGAASSVSHTLAFLADKSVSEHKTLILP